MTDCPSCGKPNPEESLYCSRCGASLSETIKEGDTTISFSPVDTDIEQDAEVLVTEEELVEGAALLVTKSGPNTGTRFVMTKDTTTAGRHPESDIFLDDITVSRRHAEIVRDEDGFKIVDKGSLNGTYVNKTRVEESHLTSGDELQIGKFKLVFLCK